MADPTNPPLWEVMSAAYGTAKIPEGASDVTRDLSEVFGTAAEIRAIADWLVPDQIHDLTHGSISELKWRERQRLRDLLLAEADRAEAGAD